MDAQGQIWGWGDNEYGTLPGCPRHNQYSPVLLSISGQFTALATAGETAFGLDAEGQLWGWGRNDLYQVGNDNPGKIADTPLPVLLPEGTAIRRVLAYNAHTAVLTENGQLWVWGSLSHGQGNTGRRMTKSLPLDATPEAPLLDADVGSLQMVALDTSGTVWGIGGGEYGQTGNGRQNAYYVTQWVDTGLHLLEASSISILTEGGPIP